MRRPSPRLRRLLLPGALAAAFAALAAVVLTRHGTPYPLDTGPHRWSVTHRPHAAAVAARTVTAAGTGPWPYLAAALGGWLGGRGAARNRAACALPAVLVLAAGQAVRFALVTAFARPRPPAADFAAHVSGHSFPSGHTTSSAIAAGLLVWGLLRTRRRAAARIAAGAALAAAVAVGCTRVYLGVHWPTDVLGGWLLAAWWLSVTLPWLTAYADGGGRRPGGPGTAGDGGADASPGAGPGEGRGQTDTPWERR